MDDTAPKIVGDRSLPCHRQRAARLSVSDEPVTRTCGICRRKYSISFVQEPHLTERLGIAIYRLEITPWVDGRTQRRLEREASRAATSPKLPFGDEWVELRC
ncbi:MAG: hypothetical protein JWO62_1119 [Acidimicrobiaceae bacterium]|nr:hypothetical protein [Acidimicrobiaceae bacterium]